jgi:hypothetical protein
MRLTRWTLAALAAIASVALVAWVMWPRGVHEIVCDYYTYNTSGQTRANSTPPTGWIETNPGSDCWIVP